MGKGGNKRKGKESERNRDCKVIKTSRQRGQDLDFQQGQPTKPRTGPSSCRLSPAELTPGFRDGLGLFQFILVRGCVRALQWDAEARAQIPPQIPQIPPSNKAGAQQDTLPPQGHRGLEGNPWGG